MWKGGSWDIVEDEMHSFDGGMRIIISMNAAYSKKNSNPILQKKTSFFLSEKNKPRFYQRTSHLFSKDHPPVLNTALISSGTFQPIETCGLKLSCVTRNDDKTEKNREQFSHERGKMRWDA